MSLTIIQVGNNPASNIYIRNKRRAIEEAGMKSFLIRLPETATTEMVLQSVRVCGTDPYGSAIEPLED